MHYSGELPLKGKSAIIIEDDALIAMGAESDLLDAGAAVVRIANSIASAKIALDEGLPFDVALVDLCLEDGNAIPLVKILSERGVAVVIATGSDVSRDQPAFRAAADILQKPYSVRDLINALMKCAPAARPLQSNSEFCWTGDGKTS